MDGFRKIDLDVTPSRQASHPARPVIIGEPVFINNKMKKNKIFKKILIVFGALLALVIALGIMLIIPGRQIYSDAKETFTQIKITEDAIKKEDIAQASIELNKTEEKLKKTKKSFESIGFVKYIPVLGSYYSDGQHLINAGFNGITSAKIFIESIEPYADILGLKGKGGFVQGTASQRIETAVTTMGKITPHIDEIAVQVEAAKKEIDEVDPNRYPPFFGGEKIRNALIQAKLLVDQGATFVTDARPLIKILPSLLGDPDRKKYLVIFQNDKELRPTGGFMTAYAIFSIEKGVIRVDDSSDIYNLDNTISGKETAPAPISKYLANVPVLHLRDSNLSPDFIESMATFSKLYKKADGYVPVDGIIALDTNVLVNTIRILDDEVYAGGVRFTSQTDSRCNCPQVIYELESLISTPKSVDLKVTTLETVQAQRKDLIGTLLYAIMDKALKSSPKKYWGTLFQEMLSQVQQKHILFNIYNKDAQGGIEALNAAGRIRSFEGDYLHINEANLGGQKSNMFVSQNVTQNYSLSSDKTITKTVTINYKNPQPPSDCNLERGNLCLNAPFRNWFRIYVPQGSKLVDSKGSEVKMTSYDELGKTVFEGFLTVRPLGSATFTISYTLPFKVKDGKLPLLIQKQPGTNGNDNTIKVNDSKFANFPLLTDKEIMIWL